MVKIVDFHVCVGGFVGAAFSGLAVHAASLAADQASQHVGETATVCGIVASATYAAQSRGRPTFLNLDKAYPNESFTIVIWEEDRSKFGAPERALFGKQVCASGVIQLYRGRPEIIVHDPAQLEQQSAR